MRRVVIPEEASASLVGHPISKPTAIRADQIVMVTVLIIVLLVIVILAVAGRF